MPMTEQQQTMQFHLTLVAIKMKVKFPCRMIVEHGGQPLTREVTASEESKFVFNQELRLKEEGDKMYTELSICLLTDKGARYISATLKLYHNQVIRAEGERLVVSLSKCMDTEAIADFTVNKVIRQGGLRKRTLTTIQERGQKVNNFRISDQAAIPTLGEFKPTKKTEPLLAASETKSQAHFPVTANLHFRKGEEELKTKEYIGLPATSVKRFGNPSPKSKRAAVHSKQKYQNQYLQDRDRVIQSEVYRDNYLKLKQKYHREAENSKNELSRRMMLQNNENHYKLEIVRFKMKNQELEKVIQEKSIRIRQLTNAIASLQSRQSEIGIMREDIANKQHALKILEDTVLTLSRQNDELRAANKDIAFKLQEKIMLMQGEIDSVTVRAQGRQQQLERELKIMAETLQFKDAELSRKNDLFEKEKRSVYELQQSIQNKLFQYDSLLQTEKASCRTRLEEAKSKLEENNQVVLRMTGQKNDLWSEMDKLKGLLLKNQYEFKLYQQQISNLRAEIDELKPTRDKYNEIFKELRIVSEQKAILQKNNEKIKSSRESTLEEITNQYRKQLQFHKRNARDLDQRSKNLSSKLIQAEGQLDLTKGSLQKLRRNHEGLNREYADLKDKQKGLKKGLKMKQQQCDDLKKQVSRGKQKNQAIFDSMKVQMGRVREQLAKKKSELQAEISKNEQLMQSNAQIGMELARLKMTYQLGEEKYQKLMVSAQEKYGQFEKIIEEHEGVIELLEEKIKSQKGNEKEYFNKLQKCDYEINIVADKNDRINKEIRVIEERNRQFEATLKAKQTELADALRKGIELQAKLNQNDELIRQLKEHLQIGKNELQKSKRIIDVLQKDYERAKSDVLTYGQKLTDKERQCQQRSQDSRKDKENISILQTKHNSLKKEYDKFKQSLTEAMNTSFAQVLHNFSLQKQENSKVTTSNDQSASKFSLRGVADLSNDLVSAISLAGKENKGQIIKLTERIKHLQRDLQMLRAQMERSTEASKRQLQERILYIEQIEEDLRNIRNEKGEAEVHYHMQVQELEQQIREYQSECQSLQSTRSEHQFSISSLKMEIQQLTEQFQKKIAQLKRQRQQYQQKLQYQYHNTQVVQKKVHELQMDVMNLNAAVMAQKQSNYKKDILIQEVEQQRENWVRQFESIRRQLKQTEERCSQLEIQYITVNEIKQKYECMLGEQESKLKEVRVFNNNILKEKEEIIRKELQKNQQIANLQNTINQLQHSLQQEQAISTKIKADYDELKEQSKRYNLQIKELQGSLHAQKNKYTQIRDKLREKEQALSQTREEMQSLKKKLEQSTQKHKNIVQELHEEGSITARQLETVIMQTNDSIRSLQNQVSKLTQQLQVKSQELAELQEALFVERENIQQMQESMMKTRAQLQQGKLRSEQLQRHCEQLVQQNTEKDQNMFELGGKIYQLENRMKEMEQQKLREIEELNNSLNVKYDEDYQQIYQKIEFIQKEKEYFKEKCQEKEEALSKKGQQVRHKQIEETELKKAYEQKIKKIQQQKLTIFTDKNKQIAKILQDNKAQFQSLRAKQSQIRKVAHELQIARTAILKQESKIKQLQSERGNQVKVYQAQIQSLRKKELNFKSYKDLIRTNQWNCERQVRKNIQGFIKRVLQVGEKEVRNQSVISLIKSLEEGLLGVIANITKE